MNDEAINRMYAAARSGDLPAVQALLEAGMDANTPLGRQKRTALQLAEEHKQATICRIILSRGAI